VKARLLLAATFVSVLVAPASVWAGPPTEQIRAHADAIIRVLEDPALKTGARRAERRAALQRIANGIFDFTEMARRSLGHHWWSLTPAQRQEFVALMPDLLARVSRVERYGGERIAYLGDAIEGDAAVVRTRLATKRGATIPIDFRMLRRGDRWMAYDIVIEGISLVANYRAQLDKMRKIAPPGREFKGREFLDLARKALDERVDKGSIVR
jgi:phospholipid transport system substrate-binding protein